MFYEEGSSLDLDLIIQNYEDDRERYWSDEGAGTEYIRLVDNLAKMLLRGSIELVQPGKDFEDPTAFDWDQVRTLLNIEPIAERIFERLEIDAAWEYSTGARSMAQRCLELADLAISASPNRAVMKFLGRLSRCYIAGFFPECVMLCRAVLENGIRETYQQRSQPLPDTMRARLDWARMCGWLSEENRTAALTVWTRGNTAVHADPSVTTEVLETIRMTLGILGELYRA
jgi:hypothetical protein